MKRVPEILALATSLIATAAFAGTAQPLPTPFPEGRYQQLSAKSPFAVASATADPKAAPTPGFATQLYVDGVAHIGQDDYVAIKSRDPDKQAPLFLQVGESSKDGLKVDRVEWSQVMGKSTVEVSKNGERATLAFDEAQIAKSGPAVSLRRSNEAVPAPTPIRVSKGYRVIPGRPIPEIYRDTN